MEEVYKFAAVLIVREGVSSDAATQGTSNFVIIFHSAHFYDQR